MTPTITVSTLIALAIGVLSDIFIVRNGLSSSGRTLLDGHPQLWAVWPVVILACSFVLEFRLRTTRDLVWPGYLPKPALAIFVGFLASHIVLLIRDVIADPTSHNLWPLELALWAVVVGVPALLGAVSAKVVAKARKTAAPQ
jgi:hypothetical protein